MVLPTDHQATEPVQPSEQSLDVPSLAIATQRTAILCGLASATAVRRDQFDVVFTLEPLVQPVTVVGPVANQFCRELVEEALAEDFFDELGLQSAPSRRTDGSPVKSLLP